MFNQFFFKVLHFGEELENWRNEKLINIEFEKAIPEGCPKPYEELVRFCIDYIVDFEKKTFSIEWLKPCFAWIRQELKIQSKAFKFESTSNQEINSKKELKTVSAKRAEKFSKQLQDCW